MGVGWCCHRTTEEKIGLEQAAGGFVAGKIGGFLANGIGDLCGKALIDPVTHKILHAAVGAMSGAIISEDITSGATSGAIGAFVAETFAVICLLLKNPWKRLGQKKRNWDED